MSSLKGKVYTMTDNVKRFEEIKKKVDSLNQKRTKLVYEKERLEKDYGEKMVELEKLGVSSIAEAKEKLAAIETVLKKTLDKAEEGITKAEDSLKEAGY